MEVLLDFQEVFCCKKQGLYTAKDTCVPVLLRKSIRATRGHSRNLQFEFLLPGFFIFN